MDLIHAKSPRLRLRRRGMPTRRRVRKRIALVAALFLLGVRAALRADDDDSHGVLRVTSYPSGANVTVDGNDVRKVTPVNISMPVGTHTVVVSVSVPNSGWNPDTCSKLIVPGNNYLDVTLLPIQTTGSIGAQGPKAYPVPQTPPGLICPAGPAGPPGPAGPQGAIGPIGPAGPTGTTGAIGPIGPAGAVGPAGPSGPTGSQCPTGPTGSTRPAGANSIRRSS